MENNGEARGQELTSRFSAPQLSGFTTLPKGMLQIMCFALFGKKKFKKKEYCDIYTANIFEMINAMFVFQL